MNKIKWICIVAIFAAGCSRSSSHEDEAKPAQTQPPAKTEEQKKADQAKQDQAKQDQAKRETPKSEPISKPANERTPAPVGIPDSTGPTATQPTPTKTEPPKAEPAKPDLAKPLPPQISPPMKEVNPQANNSKPAAPNNETAENKPAEEKKPDIVKVEPAPAKKDAPTTAAPQTSVKPDEKPKVEALPRAAATESRFKQALGGTIGANERATGLLAQLLSENDRAKFDTLGHQYVLALLEDHELVTSRVMSSQMALRKIADEGLYDDASKKRIALVQSELDRQAAKNRTKVIIRDGIMIGVSSLAIGGISGFRRVTRLAEPVDEAVAAAARKGAVLETAQADLKAMGFTGAEIDNLGLTPFRVGPKDEMGMFRNTNVPGVKWAFLDEINDEPPGAVRAVVLNWNPLGKPQGSMVVSRSMSAEEAATFENQIRATAGVAAAGERESAAETLRATPAATPRTVQANEYSVRRALGYTLGSGIALSGAYWEGLRVGEGYDDGGDLYLESLIPPAAAGELKK